MATKKEKIKEETSKKKVSKKTEEPVKETKKESSKKPSSVKETKKESSKKPSSVKVSEKPQKTEKTAKVTKTEKEKETKKRKVSEDFIFYRDDRVLAWDCSKKGFPNTAPPWVIAAVLFGVIKKGKLEGFDKEHWYMIAGEDHHVTILDSGRMYFTQYHGKFEPIPKVVMESMLITTKEKVSRKKEEE